VLYFEEGWLNLNLFAYESNKSFNPTSRCPLSYKPIQSILIFAANLVLPLHLNLFDVQNPCSEPLLQHRFKSDIHVLSWVQLFALALANPFLESFLDEAHFKVLFGYVQLGAFFAERFIIDEFIVRQHYHASLVASYAGVVFVLLEMQHLD